MISEIQEIQRKIRELTAETERMAIVAKQSGYDPRVASGLWSTIAKLNGAHLEAGHAQFAAMTTGVESEHRPEVTLIEDPGARA